MDSNQFNPLKKHFRQPALHIKLPSDGQYYPSGSLDLPETGELPVYPLTSRDEITLRTPDSLINGTSVVSIIESCCPNIKDAWNLPSIDLDAILIAIRLASYGKSMTINAACPACNDAREYEMDLSNSLSQIRSPDFKELIDLLGVKIKLKPQSFVSVNKINSLQFEEQKMMTQIVDVSIPETKRMEFIREQMQKIANINLEVLVDATEYIQTENNDIVTDKNFILEFYQNVEAKAIKQIEAKFKEFSQESGARSEKIICANCTHEFSSTIEFDYSNFFVLGS